MKRVFVFGVGTCSILGVVIGLILLTQSNFSGYCLQAGKVLSDDELLKRVAGKIYEESPDCCMVTDVGFGYDAWELFIGKLLGQYRVQVDMYYKKESAKIGEVNPYEEKYILSDECGKEIRKTGIETSEKHAKAMMSHFKKLKEQKVNKNDQ